jgi:hypothetical protein
LDSNETALYFQAHAQAAQVQRQQSEQLQRDYHLRQALLQDQIGRHLNLERLRGLPTGFLEDNPELQALRAELELRELEGQRQLEEQRLTEQELLRQQVAVQIRFQDEVRRQQQQLSAFQTQDEAVLAQQRAQAQAIAQAQAQIQAVQAQKVAQERVKAQQAVQEHVKAHMAAQAVQEHNALATVAQSGKNGSPMKPKVKASKSPTKTGKEKSNVSKTHKAKAVATVHSCTYAEDHSLVPDPTDGDRKRAAAKPKAERKRKAEVTTNRRLTSSNKMDQKPLITNKRAKPVGVSKSLGTGEDSPPSTGNVPKDAYLSHKPSYPRVPEPESALDAVAIAAGLSSPWIGVNIPRKGTIQGLLEAAAEGEQIDDAVDLLCSLKAESDLLVSYAEEGERDEEGAHLPLQASTPAEVLEAGRFKSELPALPQEPETDISHATYEYPKANEKEQQRSDFRAFPRVKSPEKGKSPDSTPRVVLDYPINVDSWWPSTDKVRAERRAAGESSDEEKVVESGRLSSEMPLFRVNDQNLRHRLVTMTEPGRLEKLNHCRIHRARTKGKKMINSTPELVFCFQVTEVYPNDIMVSCSICGTWRHAACGGHWKPYSTRDNCKVPFTAVCDNCKEEKTYLSNFPRGQQRLERQRLEHLRRSLATSAVMRYASYSKHAGTYKWPLGSVSATHVGGHTRSVQARHEKAERQWAEMVNRSVASGGPGSRSKANARMRTKDLEHVLVAIDDAESYTDRHNMMNFLIRDIRREAPIGYEKQPKNYLDPEVDFGLSVVVQPSKGSAHMDEAFETYENDSSEERQLFSSMLHTHDEDPEENPNVQDPLEHLTRRPRCKCSRTGCTEYPRFDSLFCSDGCGILAMETDLLRSFQDAGELHPSVLRLN